MFKQFAFHFLSDNLQVKYMHYYESNVVEIKKEYTEFLVSVIAPSMYEGLLSIYEYSVETDAMLTTKNTVSPGVLEIFRTCLNEIPVLNKNSINLEMSRIKEKCMCADWFDDLVRATIKSHIVLLTFSTSGEQSQTVMNKYHEAVDTNTFLHKCYIESAKAVYQVPELFLHELPPADIVCNQHEINTLIKSSIVKAIHMTLPMKLVLTEFLKNDYVPEPPTPVALPSEQKYIDVKDMLQKLEKSSSPPPEPKIQVGVVKLAAEDSELSKYIAEHKDAITAPLTTFQQRSLPRPAIGNIQVPDAKPVSGFIKQQVADVNKASITTPKEKFFDAYKK